MPSVKLTTLAIGALPPGEHWDAVVPGLVLVVGKKRRTFQLRFRSGGRSIRHRLGHHPGLSLADARDAARAAADRVDRGIGPRPALPHPRSEGALNLGTLLDLYEAHRLREGKQVKTLARILAVVRKELSPYAALPARSFSKQDMKAVRDALIARGSPVQFNRVRSAISTMMKWATEEDFVESNVALSVRRAAEHERDRVLDASELRRVWHATLELKGHGTSEAYGRLIRLLMLTGARRGEAAAMRYRDIQGDTWRQPTSKSGKPHNVYLAPTARALIGKGAPDALVFAQADGSPLTGFSSLAQRLASLAGIEERWTVHDLRRSVASHMQRLGIRPDHVEAVLNHAIPGVGLGSVYMKGDVEQAKRRAWQRWEAELLKIVGETNVVQLARTAILPLARMDLVRPSR